MIETSEDRTYFLENCSDQQALEFFRLYDASFNNYDAKFMGNPLVFNLNIDQLDWSESTRFTEESDAEFEKLIWNNPYKLDYIWVDEFSIVRKTANQEIVRFSHWLRLEGAGSTINMVKVGDREWEARPDYVAD